MHGTAFAGHLPLAQHTQPVNLCNPPREVPMSAEGLVRAVVVRSVDPQGQRRLLVTIAQRPELGAVWALPCVPQGSRAVPKVGTTVWLTVEQDMPASFVWLGILPGPRL